uniref:DEP domain-containing protein n=1 Tax=Macrostomum lignano TaxID=282301 RepID=A0A1I8F7M0_9PLAT
SASNTGSVRDEASIDFKQQVGRRDLLARDPTFAICQRRIMMLEFFRYFRASSTATDSFVLSIACMVNEKRRNEAVVALGLSKSSDLASVLSTRNLGAVEQRRLITALMSFNIIEVAKPLLGSKPAVESSRRMYPLSRRSRCTRCGAQGRHRTYRVRLDWPCQYQNGTWSESAKAQGEDVYSSFNSAAPSKAKGEQFQSRTGNHTQPDEYKVRAIRSGMAGLTLRTLLVTHSNQTSTAPSAFASSRGSLGHRGRTSVGTGRVNYILARRVQLLQEAASSRREPRHAVDQAADSCEAGRNISLCITWLDSRWRAFFAQCRSISHFHGYFANADYLPLFKGDSLEADMDSARGFASGILSRCSSSSAQSEFRSFEHMRSGVERANLSASTGG